MSVSGENQRLETPRILPEEPHQDTPNTSAETKDLSTAIKRKHEVVTPASDISTKRPRNSSDSSLPPTSESGDEPQSPQNTRSEPGLRTYTKHPRFWASDGNVLVQIGMVRFSLHRSRLVSQSVWFKKLFARCRPWLNDGDDATIDVDNIRAEVVSYLDLFFLDPTGIKAEDFEALLTAMEDGIEYCHKPPTFPIAASIFRAASILRFEKFSRFAKTTLKQLFSQNIKNLSKGPMNYAAEAIILGRDWNLPLILKRAFYDLARRKVDPPRDNDNPQEGIEEEAINRLHPTDLVRLANGRVHLMNAWISAISFKPSKCHVNSCTSKQAQIHWKFLHNTADGAESIVQTYQCDPVGGLNKLSTEFDWKTVGYCDTCIKSKKEELRLEWLRTWRNVDKWFGLD